MFWGGKFCYPSQHSLFIVAKKWKQSKCPSTDEWIKRMLYIHTIGIYLAVKINEVLIHNITQMNLENMLSERSCILYDSIYMKRPEQANPQKQKNMDQCWPWAGGEGVVIE